MKKSNAGIEVDAVARSDLLIFVHVQLGHFRHAHLGGGDLVDHRRKLHTRPAPRRPEIHGTGLSDFRTSASKFASVTVTTFALAIEVVELETLGN
ncbi:MAG: hypothetical protein WDN28_22165 [Chthoniobacter sp.]